MEKDRNEVMLLLKKSRAWMYVNAITAIVFALLTILRAVRSRHFFDYPDLVMIFFAIAALFMVRYVIQLVQLSALNSYLRTGNGRYIEKYYSLSFVSWLMEGIIYIIGFLIVFMALSGNF